jgi:hypothetical protein
MEISRRRKYQHINMSFIKAKKERLKSDENIALLRILLKLSSFQQLFLLLTYLIEAKKQRE